MNEDIGKTFVDYYKLFDVEPSAALESIRRKYLLLAKKAHPDMGGSTEAMQSLNRAYRTLADATSRAAYDMIHGIHTGRAESSYHYSAAPASSNTAGNDDYIDMFIDQVYREYSEPVRPRRRSLKSWIFG